MRTTTNSIPTTSVPYGFYTWPSTTDLQTLLNYLIREAPNDSPPHPIPIIHDIMGPPD